MLQKALILLSILYPLVLSLSAQEYRVEGKVTNQKGEPIEEVVVLLDDQLRFSDAQGSFVFEQVPRGTYAIALHRIGYEEQNEELEVNKSLSLQYTLTADDKQLDEVIIEGHREEVLNMQSVSIVEGSNLDRKKGKSLSDALEDLVGLNSIKNGSSIAKPVIHGMHSNRVLILNNGIRLEGQQWGLEHAPEIDPFIAEKLTVVKGAAGVQYGSDAIGGVVLVEPASLPDSAGIHGKISSAYLSNGQQMLLSGTIQGTIPSVPGLSWRVQGTGKRGGNQQTPDYYLDNTGVRELNYSATAGYVRGNVEAELYYSRFDTDLGIFSGSHTGNLTDLERAISSETPPLADTYSFSYDIDRPMQKVVHQLLAAKFKLELKQLGELHAKYGYQVNNRQEFDRARRSIEASGRPQLDFELTTHTLDMHLDHKPIGKLKGSIGASGMKKSNVYTGRRLIPNFRQYNFGVYAIEHYFMGPVELEAGLRYDYQYVETFDNDNGVVIREEFDYQNVSVALGGLWQPADEHQLRLSASSAFRAPNVNELFSDGVHQGVSSYERGDKTLQPEVAYNLSLTWLFNKGKWSSELSLYHNTIDNFIYLEPQFPETILTIRGAFPSFAYTQVDARFQGVDAGINYQVNSRWQVSGKATIVRARNTEADDWLINIPADRYDLALSWSGFRRKALQPYANLSVSYTAEQTRAPLDADFAPPPPAYTLLEAEAGVTIDLGNNRLDLSLAAENLGNVRYRNYLNRFRYFTDEVGRNWIIRLNYEF